MASTLISLQADPRVDGDIAETGDRFANVEEALSRLAHQGASEPPDARLRAPASDRLADVYRSFPPGALGPPDLGAPRAPRSRRKRDPLTGVTIAICLGAPAIWAWHSYGPPAKNLIAAFAHHINWTSARPVADQAAVPRTPDPTPASAAAPGVVVPPAPPPVLAAPQGASIAPSATIAATEAAAAAADRQHIETMARDLAALRQAVDQLVTGQAQLKGENERLNGELAKLQDKLREEKLQAEKPPVPKKHIVHHVPAPPAAASARTQPYTPMPPVLATSPMPPPSPMRPASAMPLPSTMPPPSAPPVATVNPPPPPPPSAAPQMLAEPQSSEPPLRPPMPVPQQ